MNIKHFLLFFIIVSIESEPLSALQINAGMQGNTNNIITLTSYQISLINVCNSQTNSLLSILQKSTNMMYKECKNNIDIIEKNLEDILQEAQVMLANYKKQVEENKNRKTPINAHKPYHPLLVFDKFFTLLTEKLDPLMLHYTMLKKQRCKEEVINSTNKINHIVPSLSSAQQQEELDAIYFALKGQIILPYKQIKKTIQLARDDAYSNSLKILTGY